MSATTRVVTLMSSRWRKAVAGALIDFAGYVSTGRPLMRSDGEACHDPYGVLVVLVCADGISVATKNVRREADVLRIQRAVREAFDRARAPTTGDPE